jgi:D-alanine-D-alanine ligase-like ATP-grasp enzyme
MRRHFKECFQKAVEAEPLDEEDVLREQLEDAHDDKYGIIPCSYYPWYEEDEKAGRWEKYAAKNADFGSMFNPWEEEDAACLAGTEAQHER